MDDGCGPRLNSLPLLEAVLCADCEIISNSGGEACQVCGSRSLLSLGRVLGGSVGSERATLVEPDPDGPRNGFTMVVNPGSQLMLLRRRNGS